jgi:hypothetical protein
MTGPALRRRVAAPAAAGLLLAGSLSGCSSVSPTVPTCSAATRLALVAQSVPGAAYVPCLVELPPGWTVTRFDAERAGTTFSLLSDRAEGRTVDVRLADRCRVAGATPEPPRTVGGRTYLRLSSIAPRYAGTLFDVFPGGCVSYRFDFGRGSHIALMEELLTTVDLVPRRQLRLDVREQLGQELDP